MTNLPSYPVSVAILMPAHNEGPRLRRVLESLRQHAAELNGVTVFLVDDGSDSPIRLDELPPASAWFNIVVARHVVNLGQGAALETARQLALAGPRFDAYVTMDSDGQHRVEDVKRIVHRVSRGADVVFGNRFVPGSNVPPGRRLLLRAARLFERTLTGLALSDTHNGLRGFSRRALCGIRIRHARMAHATEITQRVARARDWIIAEVPVQISYSHETLAKGQHAAGALTIVRDLLSHYFFREPT